MFVFIFDFATDPSSTFNIRLGNPRQGAWKIDLHAEDQTRCNRMVDHCNAITAKLTPETRYQILSIKSQIWNHPKYRNTMTSQDIYDAVLEHHVTNLDEFWSYIQRKS